MIEIPNICKSVLLVCLVLLITGCGQTNLSEDELQINMNEMRLFDLEELDSLILKTEYDSYPTDIDIITVTLENRSPHTIIYGEYYELYHVIGDSQIKKEDISGYPYPSIGYDLLSGTSVAKSYNIFERFGLLEPGEYIIITACTVHMGDVGSDMPQVAVYNAFSITENINEE